MTSASRWRPKPDPKHPIIRQRIPMLPPDHCPKCDRQLDGLKYHDCGDQGELFDLTEVERS